ncbi:MAG: shikimate kinase [Chitinophagaceae bacterium]|nr:shikimate kinase [Chitinophagaceae bacterium]
MMKIFLLGFMGTGKTYWGQLWAKQHQLRFFDLDTEIEKHTGLTIPQIFEQHGETYFRQQEQEQLLSFANKDQFILSTGGGTPCFYNNMQWMKENGLTIYLDTPVAILKERLIQEKWHRPLVRNLNEQDIETFIINSLKKRQEYYLQSHIILSTDTISDTTFDEIKRKYV